MKYLEFFNLFEGVKNYFDVYFKNEIDDLKDICLELTDIGLRVNFQNSGVVISKSKILITIDKVKQRSFHSSYERLLFDIKDIKETLERIQDYATKIGFVVNIYYMQNYGAPRSIKFDKSEVIDSHNSKPIDYVEVVEIFLKPSVKMQNDYRN